MSLTFQSQPSGKAQGKHHIIVVGAGIIGVCTAYYITKHPKFSPQTHHITIIESKRLAGGASGKAGGLLALWAFPQQLVPLSFQLHEELAAEYHGDQAWDYRRLTTVSLEGDVQNVNEDTNAHTDSVQHQSESDSDSESEDIFVDAEGGPKYTLNVPPPKKSSGASGYHGNRLPTDLNWIRQELIRDWSTLGGTDSTAQVHPYKFSQFILEKAVETGAVDLVLGKVETMLYNDLGEVNGVSFHSTTNESLTKVSTTELQTLHADQVVLAVGPWTSKILPDCPVSGLRAHSITIKPSTGTVSPYAIFTELKVAPTRYFSPEMYARKDEVYVCGEGDTLMELPETTDDVQVLHEKCDELFHYVSKLSPNLSRGHILKRQACYLPVLDVPTSSGPLIGQTNVDGLYLASGHSCWGINNAPGTGKLMAELLLDGETTSADISALDPSLYFDASIFD